MSKKGKRKSSKGPSTGTTLGALALIISLVALGLGVYQFINPPAPRVYVTYYDGYILLNTESAVDGDFWPQLNVTYTTQPGDSVLLEFSSQIYCDPDVPLEIGVYFNINGTYPPTSIRLSGETSIFVPCYMRHYIESSEGGEYTVIIVTSIGAGGTSSNMRFCTLSATVY